jgi:hypothetical protein
MDAQSNIRKLWGSNCRAGGSTAESYRSPTKSMLIASDGVPLNVSTPRLLGNHELAGAGDGPD